MHPLDHERRLEVYQALLAFVAWLEPLPRRLPKGLAVFDQLDRASIRANADYRLHEGPPGGDGDEE